MPRVKHIVYSITKQIRSYEPVRVEVCIEAAEPNDATPEELIVQARNLCESAIADALSRSGVR